MQTVPAINPATYNMLKENLSEILPELKAAFVEDGFILLEQLKDGITKGDADIISHSSHTLKSSAQNMGADTLAGYCMQIEDDPTANPEQLESLYDKALAEMHTAQDFLATLD